MDIVDFDWNSFLVCLEKKSQENQPAYLEKALDCLTGFHHKYTTVSPPINLFLRVQERLERLMEEQNFCDSHFEMYCDVKYKVCPDGISHYPAGIWVYSHKTEDKRPQVKFLRTKWEEFDFKG